MGNESSTIELYLAAAAATAVLCSIGFAAIAVAFRVTRRHRTAGAHRHGQVGRVRLAIPVGGVGSVALGGVGRWTTRPARCCEDESLPQGARVVVVESEGSTLLVTRFPEPERQASCRSQS